MALRCCCKTFPPALADADPQRDEGLVTGLKDVHFMAGNTLERAAWKL